MEVWQQLLIAGWGLFGIVGSFLGYRKCKYKKDQLGWDGIFTIYGAFVWADVVVFGIFWAIVSVVILFINNWILFLLIQSVFWVVRSLGETIYWFNQQFSVVTRYSPEKIRWLARIFHENYTMWFVFQICMQCITVVSIVLSIHFVNLWLR